MEYGYSSGKRFGRLYSRADTIQRFSRTTRSYLCKGILQDLDMKNCAPVILKQLAKYHRLQCAPLDYYTTNRKAALEEWGTNKEAFLARLFKNTSLQKVHASIKELHRFFYSTLLPVFQREYPEIWKSADDSKGNKEGSFMSLMYQAVESHILLAALEFCKLHNVVPAVLMFDGLMVYSNPAVNKAFLEDLGEFTFKETGFRMEWTEKAMTAPGEIPDPLPEKTANEEISEYIVEDFEKNKYVKDDKHIYKPSDENRYYYTPVLDEHGEPLTVDNYVGRILGNQFPQHLHRDAAKVRHHASTFLSMYNNSIRAYHPNRHLIAFKNGIIFTGSKTNPAWGVFSMAGVDANPIEFSKQVGNLIAWSYIDNEYDFENSTPSTAPLGEYGPVLDLQFGENQRARDQYLMLLFGRTAFPVAYLDRWDVCLVTYGMSGCSKSTGTKLLKHIHGTSRFQVIEKSSDMTKFSVHYARDKVGWEMSDVDEDFLIKFGLSKFKNLVEGTAPQSSAKCGKETSGDFHAHLLLTSNYVLRIEQVYNELTRRMVFCKFANKPPHMDTTLTERIASTSLLNILVRSLDVYHRSKQSLHDILDPFFLENSLGIELENDFYGRKLLLPECPYVMTKNPDDFIALADLQRVLDIPMNAKWNASLMERLGVAKSTNMVCKHCFKTHINGCSAQPALGGL
ncbi:hypothetical protein GGF32_007918, partial [Allomyces javanicus]